MISLVLQVNPSSFPLAKEIYQSKSITQNPNRTEQQEEKEKKSKVSVVPCPVSEHNTSPLYRYQRKAENLGMLHKREVRISH